jgi:hypothetical protein
VTRRCCITVAAQSVDNTESSNVIDAIHGYRVVGSVDEMDDDATDGGGDSCDDNSGCRSLTFTPS